MQEEALETFVQHEVAPTMHARLPMFDISFTHRLSHATGYPLELGSRYMHSFVVYVVF